jgi:hypothetical protein
MIKTKRSTKYNTVVNPETGKRITIGGNIYKRLVADGKVDKPGSLPDINEFVYLVDDDIWVRSRGPKFEGLMSSGYILLERKIVKKTVYNSKTENDKNIKVDTEAWKMIMNVIDVLSLILSQSCVGDITTYMRIRATCKLFCSVLDRTAPYKSLLDAKLGGETQTRCNLSLKCLDKAPERVVKCYVETYPDLFVKNIFIKGGTKWFDRLHKDEKYREILDESVQRVLSYYSGEKKPAYIQWRKIRYILERAKTIPNPDVIVDIWFDSNRVGGLHYIADRYKEKKFSDWWKIAKNDKRNNKKNNSKDTKVVEIDD